MKNFKDFLTESKKTYKFKIRVAGELPEGFEKQLKINLEKFDLVSLSAGKRTPIAEKPLDFPQLQNMEVTHFEAEVNYPTTSHQLEHYLVDNCVITHSHIVVRGENDPIEMQQGDLNEKPYESKLETEQLEQADPDAQKTVGDNRVMELLKELEKARKENDNDPAAGAPVGESADISTDENSKSPIGS
jgi:hypothetical protein